MRSYMCLCKDIYHAHIKAINFPCIIMRGMSLNNSTVPKSNINSTQSAAELFMNTILFVSVGV